jgi:hypothetical protein
MRWPEKIPLQVDRYPIESAPLPPDIIRDVVAHDALYDQAAGTVTFTLTGNTVGGPVTVGALHLADFTFSTNSATPDTLLTVSPSTIDGVNQEFTLTVPAATMDRHDGWRHPVRPARC